MKKISLIFFCFLPIVCFSKELWHINTVALMYGNTYAVPLSMTSQDNSRFVLNLSYTTDNSWGDTFSFLEVEHSTQSKNNSLYGEYTPRLSLYKISDYTPNKNTLINDVLIALNLEYGLDPLGNNFINYLAGPGLSLNIPHIQYFKLNFFRRVNQRTADSWQLTSIFGLPFSIKKVDFRIDGFADITTATKDLSSHTHTKIQLKWDLGKSLMNKPLTYYAGAEYKYWKNKFGIKGVTEQVWQALIQIYF